MSIRIRDDMLCYVSDYEKCIIFPKYVLRVLSLLSYYMYDAKVFVKTVRKLREQLQNLDYEQWDECIKAHVPKRYAKSFLNHLLWVEELIL